MTQSRQQVLELISTQKVTAAEGEALLAALEPHRARWPERLFDPLRVISTRTALIIGTLGALFSLALSRFSIRFDGAIDAHLTGAVITPSVALIDLAVAWGVPALVAFALARVTVRRVRLIDLVAVIALARLPTIAVGSLLVFMPDVDPMTSPPLLIVGALFALGALGWSLALHTLGLRAATGLKGMRWVVTAVGSIVLSELLSKAILFALNR